MHLRTVTGNYTIHTHINLHIQYTLLYTVLAQTLHQLQSFIEKHDKVTDRLEVLAGKDDLLTGNVQSFSE